MKTGFKMITAAGLILALAPLPARAEDKPELKDEKEKISYSIGMNIANNFKRSGADVDVDVLAQAIKDVLAGRELRLTDQQAREALGAYQQQMAAKQKERTAKQEEERKKIAEKNNKEGQAFLAENKTKPGVKTHDVTMPDATTAEFQYKVITEGTGAMPKSNDTVSVNYKGTLINGKEFDSSAKHGGPSKFQVNRVVRGWTEALQMMKTGAKWELYLPASLAYGDFGHPPDIEPGSTLIFEIELVGIDTPQPLTSDIIRVPSAEELKAGAKIEVIKPEDVEKRAKEEAQKAEKKQ